MSKYIYLILLFGLIPGLLQAAEVRDPYLRIFNQNGELLREFLVPEQSSVAAANLGKDPRAEIIIGAGAGQEPYVYIYKHTGELVRQFLAYDVSMKAGLKVVVCDLNRDGEKEIITGPGYGGASQIRIFNKKGEPQFTPGFFAFDPDFRGGVNLACGQVNSDKKREIIVGAGPSAGAHVRVFNYQGNFIGLDFFPFSSDDQGGVAVSLAQVDADPAKEVVTSVQSFGIPLVKIYNADAAQTIVSEFKAYSEDFYGGVQTAALDLDKDGQDEIITMPTRSGGPQVRVFEAAGQAWEKNWFAYEEDFRGGTNLAVFSQKKKIYTIPQRQAVVGRLDLFKYIDVSLTEQRLRAYKNGQLDFDFLISSGTAKYPTPTGDFAVRSKIHSMTMEHEYGPDHPDNYSLDNVPHVLPIYGDITIHGAYWHNNFGHRMSHGCINEPLDKAGELYDWAAVGDPVLVHY